MCNAKRHYRFAGSDAIVICDGVMVGADDIIFVYPMSAYLEKLRA
jgi:hypothetical protein